MATEKFSVQTILALFEMTGSEDAIRARAHEIASLLENVASGSATGIGNVREVKEIGAQGHVSEFNALVDACDVQIAYGLTTQAVATNNPERGTQALGTVAADLMDGDTKGIALECQTLAQKLIDWTVRLNFGDDYISPTAEFDTEKKAGFADVMSAVDRNIPVSKSVLYDYYKIPRPKDEEDAFVKPETSADEFILSDPSGTSIGSKKKRRRVVIV
jgi:phage gp29-like protein